MGRSSSSEQALRAAALVLLLVAAIEGAGAELTYREPQIFEVGGPGAVWTTHSNPAFFEDWAAPITFRQGDVLQFNVEKLESLYQMPERSYNACDAFVTSSFNNWFFQPYVEPKASLQLLELGMNYFYDQIKCRTGERVKVNVVNMTNIPAPASGPLAGPARPSQFFQVAQNDSSWAVPSTADYYISWAKETPFFVGDKLGFNFTNGLSNFATYNKRDISIVPYANWEECYISQSNYIWHSSKNVTYEFTSAGPVYFMATHPWLCLKGMRFVAYVYPAASASSPAPSLSVPPTSAEPPAIAPPATVPSIAPSISPTSPPSATASPSPSSLVSPAASPANLGPGTATPPSTDLSPSVLPPGPSPSSGNSLGTGSIVGAIVAASVVVATGAFEILS